MTGALAGSGQAVARGDPAVTERIRSKPGKIDRVVATLGLAITRGDYAAGDVLPREQDLESRLDAGRGVVREAVKILATKGLVVVGPRHGTRIRPHRDWNYLDRDVLSWVARGPGQRDLLLALDETRRVIEPAAAALAARRATPEERRLIRAAYDRMVEAQSDLSRATQADKAFHIAVLDATHNPVVGSFRGALEAILDAVFAIAIPGLGPNLPNHEAVVVAIETGEAEAARAAMDRLLDYTTDFVDAAFRRPSSREAAA